MTMSVLLRVIAVVCFVLATIAALGSGSFSNEAALVPAGLMFWCGSTLVP